MKTTKDLVLPDDITQSTLNNPRDLLICSQPKMGKSTILGDFTKKHNALILDFEKGGYEYISARKLSTHSSQESSRIESFFNYISIRKLLFENKGKYEYLIIDGLSDLDDLSDIGGTLSYMSTIIGKKFNRNNEGEHYSPKDIEFKSVLSLPDGAGYQHTRKWFLDQIEIFRQISPYRIYAAHILDKYIKDNNGKDELLGYELALTGKLKTILASKVTALCKLISDGDDRYLNFEVANNVIIAGSRSPRLKGKLLISKQNSEIVETFWENIYQ